jgi:hypothetical protein
MNENIQNNKENEMTQTLYAHINKRKKERKKMSQVWTGLMNVASGAQEAEIRRPAGPGQP